MRTYYFKRVKFLGQNHCIAIIFDPPNLPQELDIRYDLCKHSPDGIEWGYGGSGPAQLAFAVMYDYFRCIENVSWSLTFKYYQLFKNEIVAEQHDDEWSINIQKISEWLECVQ